ncbi:MAG TPA: phosphopentomutase [Solirubrobacteraceae bacterium]
MRRAFVVVIDACGVGALPDAADYGDAGADTLGNLARVLGGLDVPILERLGLGSITQLAGVQPAERPVLHGRLHALGPGKDSTAGHWELMGVVQAVPAPTYPEGFPPEVVDLIVAASRRGILCNRPSNGVEAIEAFGFEHLETGSLIVYTSQDSVLQIAAHSDVLAADELYAICSSVRGLLPGGHAVGRVIARPFDGPPGGFARTDGRRDFAIAPPTRSYLEELQRSGVPVHTVGKVGQLFAGVGVDVQHPGATNIAALEQTSALLESLEGGLVFTNLIETDQVYGHRHDAVGFHRALREIDGAICRWLEVLGEDDLLVLTADHGCDVTASGTDHTREHVPLLAVFEGHRSRRHDGPMADVGASVLDWICGRGAPDLPGVSFF